MNSRKDKRIWLRIDPVTAEQVDMRVDMLNEIEARSKSPARISRSAWIAMAIVFTLKARAETDHRRALESGVRS